MTFSRTVKSQASFLAYDSKNLEGESVLQIGINSTATAQLPVEDAQALADYINQKFPRETSD